MSELSASTGVRIATWGLFAFAAQGVVLTLWADLATHLAALWLLAPAALGVLLLASSRRRRRPALVVAAAVAGFGGLGMLAGGWLDGHDHGAHGQGAAGLFTWATGLMLATCVPACMWACDRLSHAGRPAGWLDHLAGIVGMLLGMVLGGAWLIAPLQTAVGSALAARHLAMVTGMTAGAGLGLWAGAAASGFFGRLKTHPSRPS